MELLWVLVVTIVFTSQAFRSNVGSNRWQSHRELSRRYENFPTSRTSSTSSSNNQPRSKFTSSPRVNQPDKERIKRSRGQESDEDEDDDGEDSVKEPNAHLDARQNSWKILAKKLETSKNTTTIFGKQVTNNPNNQKIPTTTDLLQCPHFNECAGCTQTSDFTNTPIMQRAKKFMQSQNIPFQIQVGGYLQWRTLVKLAVQPMSKWGGLRFGLYKAGSHDVLSIPQCKVHHPKINEASEFVRLAALDAGVSGYTPATAKQDSSGDLRYLQFSVSRHTGKVQLVLVWNAENYKSCSASLQRFVKRLKSRDDLFHSIHINFHVGRNNNIFDYEEKNWKLLWGPQVMKEKIGKGTFSFLPQIFKQANIDFFESAIIPYVSRFVPQDSKVAELYAGIGIIGLNVADRAKEVLLSDSNPFVEQVFDECVESFDEVRHLYQSINFC